MQCNVCDLHFTELEAEDGIYAHTPSCLLRQDAVGPYRVEYEVLANELYTLRTSVTVLQLIAEFPWNWYGEPDDFLNFLAAQFYRDAILGIFRVWIDPKDGHITLRTFATQLVGDAKQAAWLDPDILPTVSDAIARNEPDETINDLSDRLLKLRHTHIGHNGRVARLKQTHVGLWPSLDELSTMVTFLFRYFNSLAFPNISDSAVPSVEADTEAYLNRHAVQSTWSDSFDRFPDYWERKVRPELRILADGPALVADLNARRVRHGLPAVPW